MIFQEVLAQTNSEVLPLQQVVRESDPIKPLIKHWNYILTEIKYFPIFYIAHELLMCLSADEDVHRSIFGISEIAHRVVGWRASLRHDLAGRIYHRLLTDAKYLGAYYTSIPAAALLAKLALGDGARLRDWSDLKAWSQFKVADFACGTGTLLMAVADAITDNYIRSAVEKRKPLTFDGLQRVLVNDVIYGFDVLHAALHLTASTLALRVPDLAINVTHLFRLPFAEDHDKLGSLEFFRSSLIGGARLFGTEASYVTGKGTATTKDTTVPNLDLCIMNPPFTSSRQPNLLFGSVPDKERSKLQKRLKKLVKMHRLPVSITAGLAAVFTVLGDSYVKEGGRLALVLQRTALSGIAWRRTRELLSQKYDLEYVIVSHEPDHWNFSDTTELSEVLIVARKRTANEEPKMAARYVNLWHNPRNAIESLTLHRLISTSTGSPVASGTGVSSLVVGPLKYGEMLIAPPDLTIDNWAAPCAFGQTELVRCLFQLFKGQLLVPGESAVTALPLKPLSCLGTLGPDPRDVYDAFDITESTTSYPALWGAKGISRLAQKPNMYLEPLPRARKGRNLRKVKDLWPKAGRVLLTQRPWLNTKCVTAVRFTHKALADVWWPFVFSGGKNVEQLEKAFVVWLNSTPALVLLLGHREETRGAWIQFKKPALERLPVLDVMSLNSDVITKLAAVFDKLADRRILPFPQMKDDPVRAEIDAEISTSLNLPSLHGLRELLSREPIFGLSMKGLVSDTPSQMVLEPSVV
jgi:hypothetical protein